MTGWRSSATPTCGGRYEYLLSKFSTAGVNNGQFRAHRYIIRMMVELLDPKPEDVICESRAQSVIQFSDCRIA